MISERVGIIGGAGWLGSTIARSLVSSGTVDPARLICSYRSAKPAKPADWKWTQDNAELAAMEAITTAQGAKDQERCRSLAAGSESPAIRLVGAWCDHESGNPRRALDTFKTVALAPTTPDAERADAYKGWVIAARALEVADELDLLIERGLLSPDEEKALTREIGIARFWTAYDKSQYHTAMTIMEELYANDVEITDRELVTTGWAAYNSGECGKAWNLFKRMMRSTDLEIVAEARRGFQAVQGVIKTDRQQICGRDRSVPTPGLFTAQP